MRTLLSKSRSAFAPRSAFAALQRPRRPAERSDGRHHCTSTTAGSFVLLAEQFAPLDPARGPSAMPGFWKAVRDAHPTLQSTSSPSVTALLFGGWWRWQRCVQRRLVHSMDSRSQPPQQRLAAYIVGASVSRNLRLVDSLPKLSAINWWMQQGPVVKRYKNLVQMLR